MRLMWAQKDSAKRRDNKGNLFIKNLGEHIDSKAIYDTFTMFGPILSCKVMLDDSGKSKGYGFIHFESPEAAEQAINKVNGMELDGKEIFVAHFQSRDDRHNYSEAHFTNWYVMVNNQLDLF